MKAIEFTDEQISLLLEALSDTDFMSEERIELYELINGREF